MPQFQYRALTGQGRPVQGEIAAPDRNRAIALVQRSGHLVIRIEEVSGPGRRPSLGAGIAPRTGLRSGIGAQQIEILTGELATMLQAGLPLDQALAVMIEVSESRAVREMLASVARAVAEGTSLSEAMAKQTGVFPTFYLSMLRAGEAGGVLKDVLLRLVELMARSRQARERVRSSLLYPAILVATAGVSMVVLMTVVLPQFRILFADAGDRIPQLTRVVMATSDALLDSGPMMLAALLAAGLLTMQALRRPTARLAWDRWLLRLPGLGGMITRGAVARFARTLSTLHTNGVPLPQALSLVRDTVGNGALAVALDGVRVELTQGRGLTEPLRRTGLFPPLALHMLHVGEESGHLNEMLLRVADVYDGEVERAVERLLTLLVPVVTLGLGLIIAVIIASILVAILSINDLAFV